MRFNPRSTVFTVISGMVFIIPYIIGIYTHDRFNHMLVLASRSPWFDVEPVQYKLGWLQSTATSKVILRESFIKEFFKPFDADTSAATQETVELMLSHTIDHGPVIWKEGKGLVLALAEIDTTWDPKALLSLLENTKTETDKDILAKGDSVPEIPVTVNSKENEEKPPLTQLNATISLTGQQVFQFETNAFSLQEADDTMVEVLPFTAKFFLSRGQDQFEGELSLPELQLTEGQSALMISDLRWRFNYVLSNAGAWVPLDQALSIQEIDFHLHPEAPSVLITGIKGTGNCYFKKKQALNCMVESGFSRLMLDNQLYGPFEFSAILDDFDASIFSWKGTPETLEEKEQRWEHFFSSGPKIAIRECFLKTAEGTVQADVLARTLPKKYAYNTLWEDIEKTMDITARINIPKSILQNLLSALVMHTTVSEDILSTVEKEKIVDAKVEAILQESLLKRILTPNRTEFNTQIQVQDGVWMINGENHTWEEVKGLWVVE